MQSRILPWIIVAALGLLGCSTQPSYEGRTLKQWVMLYHEADEGSPEEQQTMVAVRSIGTNAIPYLTTWIADNDWRICQTAVHIFKVLGPEAAMAVPDLERMLMGTNELVATLASEALANIGEPALPVLIAALTNRQFRVATDAGLALIELGTNARPAVPILLQQIDHHHWAYRQRAANVLGNLAIEPDTVVPALARLLRDNYKPVRFTALAALGEFCAQAQPAIPAISRLLVDLDENVRKAATNTLHQIAPESPPTFTY
jgi:HEAT repeat protein